MTTRSWTAWLLDAYSSVTSPPATEQANPDNDQKNFSPKPLQASSSTASVSPYGPYVRTGRGGAGNFAWQSEEPMQNTNDTVEAQNPSTLSERRKAAELAEHLDTGVAVKNQAAQRPASQYIRVGRGMIQSNDVQSSPQSQSLRGPSNMSEKAQTSLVVQSGRGGAGNHAAAAELNERILKEKQDKERTEAEQRRGKIEEEVQNILPPPAGAWLGGRTRSVEFSKPEV